MVAKNTKSIFPSRSKQQQKIHQQGICQEMLRFACEYDYLASHPKSMQRKIITSMVSVSGKTNLQEAIDQPKGVMILSIHLGGFLFGFLALSFLGKELGYARKIFILKQAGASPKETHSYAHFDQGVSPLTILRTENHPAAAILKGLQEGNALITLLDIPPSKGDPTIPVQFLGRPCSFPSGLIQLALRAESTILPVFTLRETGAKQLLTIYPPIYPTRLTGPDPVKQATQRLADLASAAILSHPTLWHHWPYLHLFLANLEEGNHPL